MTHAQEMPEKTLSIQVGWFVKFLIYIEWVCKGEVVISYAEFSTKDHKAQKQTGIYMTHSKEQNKSPETVPEETQDLCTKN